MPKIEKISDEIYRLKTPISVGMIVKDKEIIVIDTSLDEGYGRKILRFSKEVKKEIIGIINTHSHADHFGGNNFLKKRTGAWTVTSKIEKALIENPIFEPIYLFGGVPFEEMRTKFLEGKPSKVDMIIEEEKTKSMLEDLGVEIIELYGHSPAHIGVIYKDIIFIGDVVMPEEVIRKYKMGYLYDVYNEKASLKKLKSIEKRFYIPGHGDVMDKEEIDILIDINLKNIAYIESLIIDILSEPLSTETAFTNLIEKLNIEPDLTQILLLFSTFKGFLSGLKKEGILQFFTEKGKIMWKKRA